MLPEFFNEKKEQCLPAAALQRKDRDNNLRTEKDEIYHEHGDDFLDFDFFTGSRLMPFST
jgi:hypothetical protein